MQKTVHVPLAVMWRIAGGVPAAVAEAVAAVRIPELATRNNKKEAQFRSHSLTDTRYPVIWTDALYEKVRMDDRVFSMAVMVVCGVNEQGHRDILAMEPMLDESKESYSQLFQSLLESRSENTAAGGLRCEQRADCRRSI